MLLIASETGHVYSYATEKLRPIIQGAEGEQLVLSCLKRPQDPHDKSGSTNSKPIKMEVIPCESNPNTIDRNITSTIGNSLNFARSKFEESSFSPKFQVSSIGSFIDYILGIILKFI